MAYLSSELKDLISPQGCARGPLPKSQQGTALVISLILLLLMTIIGVSAMRDTTLQERMVGNMQDRQLAFQASEASLRAGEAWLELQGDLDDDALQRLPDPSSWDGGSAKGSVTIAALAENPSFHVGEPYIIQPSANGVDDVDLSAHDFEMRFAYPVVSRGVGRSDNTIVILRTLFIKVD